VSTGLYIKNISEHRFIH